MPNNQKKKKTDEVLETWTKLKTIIRRRIRNSKITFRVVQIHIKELQKQANQVGKEIKIWGKLEPKRKLKEEELEAVSDLFKKGGLRFGGLLLPSLLIN